MPTNKTNTQELKKVVIDLSDSTYAHAFKNGARIHQQEYDRAIRLIDEQYNKYKNYVTDNSVLHDRYHNTISIFGGRGTGKTSFIHSILNHYDVSQINSDLNSTDREAANYIEILGIIDPTILEEKGHIFLYIISLINEKVCKHFAKEECIPNSNAICMRKMWKSELKKLAKGLPSLDSLGLDYRNNNWQDNDFIMEKGLEQVGSALALEASFHNLVDQALTILGKRLFILAFDDIDVNIKKGWSILECIRKYLTTPKIITLLSGNLKFYSNNIRIQQWEQLATLVKYEALNGGEKYVMNKLNSQVNEIEGQYLLKIFKAENRIHLHSIHDAIKTYKWHFLVKDTDSSKSITIQNTYKTILNKQNILNEASVDIFQNYLIGLSVRTQINLMRSNAKNIEDLRNLTMVETFLSRMYASKIDVDLIVNNPRMINVVILDYLLRYKILQDSYLLLPTNDDENVNGCVTGLTFLLSDKIQDDPSLVFDYMLRIGYIRNILLTSNAISMVEDMCKFAGAFQDISMKNFIGLSMAYLISQKEFNLREHTTIYALASVAKENRNNTPRIDEVFKKETVSSAQRFIGFIPLCALKSVNTNGSSLYYSAFILLAGICQIIKAAPNGILHELKSLQLLRYYPRIKENTKNDDNIEERDLSERNEKDENSDDVVKLVELLKNWVSTYKKGLPPYAIGRIITRFYSTSSHIRGERLGEIMHRYIIAFLNACLIDEAREIKDEKILLKLNYSNAVTSDYIFLYNLKAIKDIKVWEHMKFTKWMMECPLIQSFLSPDFYNNEAKELLNEIKKIDEIEMISVYNILNDVMTKNSGI